MIWKGNGFRRANFLRLWSFRANEEKSAAHQKLEQNVLETVFCFAFRSLSDLTLQEYFDDLDSTKTMNLGSNVLSPLLQSFDVSGVERSSYLAKLDHSADPEIQAYIKFRAIHKQQAHNKEESLKRGPLTKEEFKRALLNASREFSSSWIRSLDEPAQLPRNEDEMLAELKAEIQEHHASSTTPEFPFGALSSKVGFVLDGVDCVRVSSRTNGSEVALPWGIREVGFGEQETLVRTFDFLKYAPLTPQSITSPNDLKLIKRFHRKLLLNSSLKIVFLWGPWAEECIINALDQVCEITIHIRNRSYRASTCETGSWSCLFIELPRFSRATCSFHKGSSLLIGDIFKLAATLTGIHNIQPYRLEGILALKAITKLRQLENDGASAIEPDDFSPGLRAWLARRGFPILDDLRELKTAAGSIVAGMSMLLTIVPRRPIHAAKFPSEKLPNNQKQEFCSFPKDAFELVKKLYFERNPTLFHGDLTDRTSSSDGASVEPVGNTVQDGDFDNHVFLDDKQKNLCDIEDEETEIISEEAISNSFEQMLELDNGPSAQKIPIWILRTAALPTLRPKRNMENRRWREEKDVFRGKAYEVLIPPGRTKNRFTFAFHDIVLPKKLDIGNGRLFVYIDDTAVQDVKHPHVFALDCFEEDPARFLAIKICGHATDGTPFQHWMQKRGISSAKKMNTLADLVLEGVTDHETAQRPRRWEGYRPDILKELGK